MTDSHFDATTIQAGTDLSKTCWFRKADSTLGTGTSGFTCTF